MRFKLFSLFLGIQLFSFAMWNTLGMNVVYPSAEITPLPAIHSAAEERVFFSARQDGSLGHPVNETMKTDILKVLDQIPQGHYKSLRNIILDYNPETHRGLGGQHMIILRSVNIDRAEMMAVLLHEIGHTVDIGYLGGDEGNGSEFHDHKAAVSQNDPSLGFYRISWINEKTLKREMSNLDFVSGYAMSNPFEDFAESYVYYILHNREFRKLAEYNPSLAQKYEFLKEEVFNGETFETGKEQVDNSLKRPWDITVLSYDLPSFIAN